MRLSLLAVLPLALAGCAVDRSPEWASVREVTPAFLAEHGAMHAALATDSHGRVALTYVTRDSGGTDLWLATSTDGGLTFAAPKRVNERRGGVSSFPEGRPVPAFGADGRLAIAWSEPVAGAPMAANLLVRSSGDGGLTLGPVARVNDDSTGRACWHGFGSIAFLADGSLLAAWMDERDNPPAEGEASSASLYAAVSHDGGQRWEPNVPVTDRLCPCCRASIVATPEGAAIAYRAAGGNLRDPALALSFDGGATFEVDTLLSPDGWKLDACPAVGVAIAAGSGGGGSVAWYTEAQGPAVWLAPWRAPQGLAGVKRGLLDSLAWAGHPRLAAMGAATLVAVEGIPRTDTTRRVLAVRSLDPGGELTPWLFLGARADAGWIAPLSGRAALAAWSEKDGAGKRLRVVRLERR